MQNMNQKQNSSQALLLLLML
ncbi:hypothetical protein LEUM_0479 [Leuconostoc mesenteroides subsp. mesenteroides ATCC 8293]|uniref:Uncharacterized protein n=1 Tax=Leuconostoc mesenteroides subsp. mesenteroides (strain ATCC 8293 / DSM 20343 / BCRC 11652 / CCM 1803 / JCM 6124 / NCDO 523 / NBRC 100496 / NCIMB 8023 / NCTC 12954 / NRRL B-1118 / 37Y) TaxID=203120 RepID=Q03YX7_LEUMM|nr:hypothetical protein LEUM_0479 [Leuconostoc mesenteroides subsp. mesenteroides ATCC 8293]